MKKQLLLICLLSFAFILNAQDETENEIAKNKNWDIGYSKTVNNCEIKRILGKNGSMGVTNVTYKPLNQVIKTYNKKADDEKWTSEELANQIEKVSAGAAGGMINIYMSRNPYDWADFVEFTLIVMDSLDSNEIFRKDISWRGLPAPIYGSNWSTLKKVDIPKPLYEKRINIYIIDKIGDELKSADGKFKFEVTLN